MIVDRRKDHKSETGLFEMIYKQNMPRAPAYLGMSLSVRGRRVFKNRSKRSKVSGKENELRSDKRDMSNLKAPPTPVSQPCYTPKEISANMYDGPIIGDLMEEIQNSYLNYCENGIDFVPMSPQHIKLKKKMVLSGKADRVSKSDCGGAGRKIANKKRFSSSIGRKSKGSEKVKKNRTPATPAISSSSSNDKGGPEMATVVVRNDKFYCKVDSVVWERNTASILKGKNILLKLSPSVNKNCLKNDDRCLGLGPDYLRGNALKVFAIGERRNY